MRPLRGQDAGGRPLLLVENDAEYAAVVSAHLDGTRYHLTIVDSIRSAKEVLVGQRLPLVLLDQRVLGEEPAAGVADLLLTTDGAAVVVLAHGDTEPAYQCLDAGAQDFVRKERLSSAALLRSLDRADARARAVEVSRRLELAERRATLGAIASYVGHEVNNHVAVMAAGLEVAIAKLEAIRPRIADDDTVPFDEVIRDMRDGVAAAERCGHIVGQLKELAGPRDEQTSPETDVGAVVHRCIRTMAAMLRHHAAVSLELSPCRRAAIERNKLGQVLVNLLRNAAEALEGRPDGAITISTREQAGNVVLAVSDNGPGIPPERRATVFQPFFTSKADGTGVGLAICSEIVAAAGGTIRVESSPHQGATFVVTLPIADAAADAMPSSIPGPNVLPRRRILFVDDDEDLRRSVVSLLRREHEVVEAGSGAEALDVLARGAPIDVIICDLMMRGIDGVSVYETVRTRYPALRRRFAFLTGGAFTESAGRLAASGEVMVLRKPCTLRNLSAAIAALADAREDAVD